VQVLSDFDNLVFYNSGADSERWSGDAAEPGGQERAHPRGGQGPLPTHPRGYRTDSPGILYNVLSTSEFNPPPHPHPSMISCSRSRPPSTDAP
jgi:hypothetical protein